MGNGARMAAHAEPLPTSGRSDERESGLTPTLTRKMLLLFIVGDILGGGIYARTGEVAGEIGGAIWTGFALAAVIAAFTAASYAELVSKFPQAAGAALYVHKAFKAPLLTFIVLRGDVQRGQLGRRAGDRVRRRLPERVRRVADRARRAGGDRDRQRDQLPRHQGVGELQPRVHADRARRAVPGGPDRRRVPVRRRRRPGARRPVQRRRDARAADRRRRLDRLLRADRLRGRGQRPRGD